MKLSRRSALVGLASAAATVAIPGCGGSNALTPPPSSKTLYDLIVVGAGCAGISAARTALGYGAKVLVLEAQAHIGGRAYTDTTTFSEIGFDLGAQFFQNVLDGNELFDIARAQGLTVLDVAGNGPPESMVTAIMRGVAAASASDVTDFAATLASLKKAILTTGALIDSGAQADVAVNTVVSSFSSLPWYIPAAAQSFGEIVGPNGSLLDLYVFTLAEPAPYAIPGGDFVIKIGMGSFIASLAKGISVMTSAPVTAITTGGPAILVTANGVTYQGKTLVVTVPTNVLAKSNKAGGIQFTPALPASYVSAFAGLPLLPAYKALLGFKPSFQFNVPGIAPSPPQSFTAILPLVNTENSAYFPNFWNTNTCEFVATGSLPAQLEAAGQAGAASILLRELETAFPGATAAWDGRITASSWLTNPYFGGAFSAALPGQFPARAVIAQPIGNQLWFAGEATSSQGIRGTLLAAYRTGAASAASALKTVGMAVRS